MREIAMKDFEAFCCPIPYYGHYEEDRLKPQKPIDDYAARNKRYELLQEVWAEVGLEWNYRGNIKYE